MLVVLQRGWWGTAAWWDVFEAGGGYLAMGERDGGGAMDVPRHWPLGSGKRALNTES